jgi:hypothetical protein
MILCHDSALLANLDHLGRCTAIEMIMFALHRPKLTRRVVGQNRIAELLMFLPNDFARVNFAIRGIY